MFTQIYLWDSKIFSCLPEPPIIANFIKYRVITLLFELPNLGNDRIVKNPDKYPVGEWNMPPNPVSSGRELNCGGQLSNRCIDPPKGVGATLLPTSLALPETKAIQWWERRDTSH